MAASGLLAVVVALYWLDTREERHLVLPVDLGAASPVVVRTAERSLLAPAVAQTPIAERRDAELPSPHASPEQPVPTPLPAVTASPVAPRPATVASPAARELIQRRPLPAPTRRVAAVPTVPTPRAEAAAREAAPRVPSAPALPSGEKPSVGTDLREATMAYRAAIETHNTRVDEYNAIADEIQRRRAWDDNRESRALRARLERARGEVERTRANAEAMRVRMEEVRAWYR